MATTRQLERDAKNAQERARRAHRRDSIAVKERARRDALKRRMIDHRGGACVRCSRTLADFGHTAAFDFHHRDPTEKRFNLCGSYTRRWQVLEAELLKCDLMCACCHRIIEAIAADAAASATCDSAQPMVVPASRGGRPALSTELAMQAAADEHTRETIRSAASRVKRQEDERLSTGRANQEQPSLFGDY